MTTREQDLKVITFHKLVTRFNFQKMAMGREVGELGFDFDNFNR